MVVANRVNALEGSALGGGGWGVAPSHTLNAESDDWEERIQQNMLPERNHWQHKHMPIKRWLTTSVRCHDAAGWVARLQAQNIILKKDGATHPRTEIGFERRLPSIKRTSIRDQRDAAKGQTVKNDKGGQP